MQVKHGLPRIGIAVHDHSIAIFADAHLFGDFLCGQEQVTDVGCRFRGQVVDRRNLDFRDDQVVVWSLWVDVLKRQGAIGFINDFRWNFTLDDLRKKGWHNAFIFAKVGNICQRNFS